MMVFPGLSAAPLLMGKAAGPSSPGWNPLDKSASITLSDENFTAVGTTLNTAQTVRSVVSLGSGSRYFEVTISASVPSGDDSIGLLTSTKTLNTQLGVDGGNSLGYKASGVIVYNSTGAGFYSAFTTGDVIGVALNLITSKVFFSKNGVWQDGSSPSTGTGGISIASNTLFAGVQVWNSTAKFTGNFGATPFAAAPPSGYLPWSPE